MRCTALIGVGMVLSLLTTALAQPPRDPGRPEEGPPGERRSDAQRPRGEGDSSRVESAVARMMAFDANDDGKVSKDEMPDERLSRLFERADADRDGAVTREEFTAQFTKDAAALGNNPGPGGFGPGGGRGGFGPGGQGPGGQGPNFPGEPGGFRPGPPPRPGQVLPPPIIERLDLNEEQLKQLEQLQKVVDERLEEILTKEQRRLLNDLPNRGPGGPGFGGQGGFGPPPRNDPGEPRGPGAREGRPGGRPQRDDGN